MRQDQRAADGKARRRLAMGLAALATAMTPLAAQTAPDPAPARSAAAPGVDMIITGGPILTMDGDQPAYVEAIAINRGSITFAGSAEAAMTLKGEGTVVKNLAGKTLAPGFIDGHAHVQQFGAQAVGANLLAPPDGGVNSIDDVVARLQDFARSEDVKRTGWIFGTGYDDSLLGRHPTRHDLDKVSTTVPVMATHISGHFAAVNTAALKLIGYGAGTANPEGGVIRREKDGKTPNGVLEELAAIPHMAKYLAPNTRDNADYFLARGLELAKSYGYTTANEGRMFAGANRSMEDAAARGLIDIDVIGWQDYLFKGELDRSFSRNYVGHYRLGGLKITLDGSPQGRTAWRSQPYLLPPDGQKAGYMGYPAIPDTKTVEALLDEAYAKGWPVKVHANGDAAIDQLFAALRPVEARYGVHPGQVILIHGQYITPDQVGQLKPLGIFPSMFPMHSFYWGDWHSQIIGPKLGARISPMRSILATGLHATSHSDAPVALPNLMQVVWATVNRTSRSGKVIGPEERVTAYEAMKMITLWGAEQWGEAAVKGSIAPGKAADLVVLSDNPVTIDPARLNQIQVLETIKDGKTVWTRK